MPSELDDILGELQDVAGRLDGTLLDAAVQALGRARRVVCLGAGRSGLAAAAFAQRLMHLGMDARWAGEITVPRVGRGDLLWVISGSGDSQSLATTVETARRTGATVALVTAGRSRSSALARRATTVIPLPVSLDGAARKPRGPKPRKSRAGTARGDVSSIQPGRSLFEQAAWLFGDAVILRLTRRGGRFAWTRHTNLD